MFLKADCTKILPVSSASLKLVRGPSAYVMRLTEEVKHRLEIGSCSEGHLDIQSRQGINQPTLVRFHMQKHDESYVTPSKAEHS